MVETYKDLLDKLPLALWGYQTLIRTPMGLPLITYKMEVVLSVELDVLSLLILLESQVAEVGYAQAVGISLRPNAVIPFSEDNNG